MLCSAYCLVEADEMASFVQQKANKQWIWLAMAIKTCQVMALHVGDRSRTSAKRLWVTIPEVYRQHATFYTDQYVVCESVIRSRPALGDQQVGTQDQSY